MPGRGLAGESAEMYLKSLLELGGDERHVPIATLAQRLGVSPISATERIHRLQGEGQLDHQPYQGVRLTRQGKATALRVVRRHRLWECFLHDRLGLGWERTHALACQLEHAVGDEVTDALAAHLGEPAACPHGNPIPGGGRALCPPKGMPLADLQPGQRAVLLRIDPETPDVLAALADAGVRTGVALEREAGAPTGQIRLRVAGRTIRLPIETTRHMTVTVQD
jgi:DtxR family Mn-dependent transcriptional regulator